MIRMNLSKLKIKGSPHIGVFIFANDVIAIVPPELDRKTREEIAEVLNVEVFEAKVAGTDLNGVMIAGNDKGIILPRNVLDEEYVVLKKALAKHGLNIYISRSKYTAMGNVILLNNRVGLVSEDVEKSEIVKIKDFLEIEIYAMNIMQLPIPGGLAVVTDRGGVIHPDVSDEEVDKLKRTFGFQVEKTTVNAGIPFVKSGVVCNNKGILVGELTTGPEILRIRRGLMG